MQLDFTQKLLLRNFIQINVKSYHDTANQVLVAAGFSLFLLIFNFNLGPNGRLECIYRKGQADVPMNLKSVNPYYYF